MNVVHIVSNILMSEKTIALDKEVIFLQFRGDFL